MGCHTWCFVSIEEKQRDWRKLILKSIQESAIELKNEITDTVDLKKCCDSYCDHYRSQLKFLEEKLKKDTLKETEREEIQKSIKYYTKELEYWSLENIVHNNKKMLVRINKLLNTFKDEYLDSASDFIRWVELDEDSINSSIFFSLGLTKMEDGKIYRELSKLEEDIKDPGIHDDIFRIYNYDAKPCRTAEECFDRCAENNITLDLDKKEYIKEWFKKYPDTIIEFG